MSLEAPVINRVRVVFDEARFADGIMDYKDI